MATNLALDDRLIEEARRKQLLVQQAKEQALLFNRQQMLSAAWQQIEQ